MEQSELARRIAGIAALDQPLRRDVYRLLAAAVAEWLTRDQAAAALGVPRTVAAFHLDKLVDAGVVDVRFERTSGRRGPGAGRPSKLYRLAQDEMSVTVPERHYDLAGSVLAAAVADAARTGTPIADCLRAAAETAGERFGQEAEEAPNRESEGHRAVLAGIARLGYEPRVAHDGTIELANCPFHRLAEQHRDLVCGMNLDFLRGFLRGAHRTERLSPSLDPSPGACCVRFTPT